MNNNERAILDEIARRLRAGKAYRGLFNLLFVETQQALAAVAPVLVTGDGTSEARLQAADACVVLATLTLTEREKEQML